MDCECNLSCKFCYNHWRDGSSPRRRPSDPTIVCRVLQRLLSSLDIDVIVLSGGEITLRPDLLDIVSQISVKNIPIVLTTNGTLLTKHLIKQLISTGVATFQIPLLSCDQAMHDYLSGRPSWGNAARSLVMVREAGGVAVIVFVATEHNIDHFPSVVEASHLLGVRHLIFNDFVPNSGAGRINASELAVRDRFKILQVLKLAEEIASRLGLSIEVGTPLEIAQKSIVQFKQCYFSKCPVGPGQKRFVLDGFGNIRLCPQSSHIVGNILREDDIPAILNGSHGLFAEIDTTASESCICKYIG